MSRRALALTFFAVGLLPATAYARYDYHDATRDCERYVTRAYGYDEFSDIQVQDEGHHDYKVRGKVVIHGARDRDFICNINHKEVVNVKFLDEGQDDRDTTAAVGAGLLGLALVGLAVALDEDDPEDQPHQWQGSADPFNDRQGLERACKHELKRHLKADHGDLDHIRIQNSHLRGRDLDGEAHVDWENGMMADLSFTCHFDRQANIYDGEYRYTTMSGEVRDHVANQHTPTPAESNCMGAVANQVGNGDVSLNRSFMSEETGATTVYVNVPGAQAPWVCYASYSGEVYQVQYGGGEGAL